jgi:glucuronyl/N-acetylglucosaminyl transferase EXT2
MLTKRTIPHDEPSLLGLVSTQPSSITSSSSKSSINSNSTAGSLVRKVTETAAGSPTASSVKTTMKTTKEISPSSLPNTPATHDKPTKIVAASAASDNNNGNYNFKVALRPLRPIDYELFTVRINTWKREADLKVSIEHHLSCSAVAQIQVVWCIQQDEPPEWLMALTKTDVDVPSDVDSGDQQQQQPPRRLVVERHDVNSLNERFRVLHKPLTRGILSIDDDILRPCLALDQGFFKWTLHPDRQVGYDARGYNLQQYESSIDDTATTTAITTTPPTTATATLATSKWAYSYESTTKKSNTYSITLSRFSFQHVDYITSYMEQMPAAIRDKVEKHFNCEDIALSLWVSACTNGQAPLLADFWAMGARYKLPSPGAISATADHKQVRDECMEEFAEQLNLKNRLQVAEFVHTEDAYGGYFECGAPANTNTTLPTAPKPARLVALEETLRLWKIEGKSLVRKEKFRMQRELVRFAKDRGITQE